MSLTLENVRNVIRADSLSYRRLLLDEADLLNLLNLAGFDLPPTATVHFDRERSLVEVHTPHTATSV